MAKTYGGNRPLKEIKAAVKRNGWLWDQSRHDGGSDCVTFSFASGRKKVVVVYNTFNGKFTVMNNGNMITEHSTDMDHVKWYADLLDIIYRPRQVKKAA